MQPAPRCPKCANTQLAPSRRSDPGARKDALSCPQCHGMWLPRTDAEFLARQGSVSPEALPEQTPAPASDADRRTGPCPFGHGLMGRARVDLDTTFYLERCLHCGGVWFDAGEWHRLATSHLLGSLLEFWTPAWRWRSQQEKARKAGLERLSTRLGPELFEKLQAVATALSHHPAREEALAFLLSEARPRDNGS
jgi:Zn-finger nucleic acid-binding protein